MFKHLALCLMLLPLTVTNTCSTGCLRCVDTSTTDTTKVCKLCDTISGYYLEDGDCVASDDTHCAYLLSNGYCSVCDADYYVDSTTHNCVAVPTANKISNCMLYSNATTCSVCQTKYYLSSLACVNTGLTVITNCLYYGSATTCSVCQNGYQVNSTNTACTSIGSTCIGYSEFECQTCQTGFIINKNLYKDDLYKFSSFSERTSVLQLIIANTADYSVMQNTDVCEEGNLDNCVSYTDLKNCEVCETYYIMDSNNHCQEQPITMITNCATYSSIAGYLNYSYQPNYTCVECTQGYYVSSGRCTAVTSVENCSLYSTVDNECADCNTGYYLNNTKSCTAYATNAIANCSVYKTTFSGCATCASGFALNTAYSCSTIINNCATYNSNGSCTACNSNYYLTGGACSAITKTHCATTAASSDACLTCEGQYFFNSVAGTTCGAQHSTLSNCSNYSDVNTYQCEQCSNGYLTLQAANVCQDFVTTTVSYCTQYNSTTQACEACSQGYLNTTTGLCVQTLTVNNCLKGPDNDGSTCSTCDDKYGLYSKLTAQMCFNEYPTYNNICKQDDLTGASQNYSYSCSVCGENAVSFYNTVDYVCVQDEIRDMILQANSVTATTNCRVIGENGVCDKCDTGYYRNSSNACVNACTTDIDISYGFYTCNTTTNNTITSNGSVFKCNYTAGDFLSVTTLISTSVTSGDLTVDVLATEDKYIPHQLNVQPALSSCYQFVPNTTKINNVTISTYSNNYKNRIYVNSAANDYKTIRCEPGTVGTVSTVTAVNYLTCDGVTVNNDQIYNVPAYWTKFYSVTKCVDSSQTPVLAGQVTGGATFAFAYAPWKYDATYDSSVNRADWISSDTNGKSITCVDLSSASSIKSAFSLNTAKTATPLTNCGLAVLNLNVVPSSWDNAYYASATSGTNVDSLICIACKPGYKSGTTDSTQSVHNCTAIANCTIPVTADDQFFDGCPKCATNYMWEYNSGIKYDSCIDVSSKTKSSNCIAMIVEAANDTKCSVCAEGYILTSQGTCVTATASGCTSFSLGSRDNTFNQYLTQKVYECSQCSTGNSLIVLDNSQNICLTSTDGIDHCKYQLNDSIYCDTCETGYTRINDGSGIISCGGNIANCYEQTLNASVCDQCNTGYSLINGSCVAGSTANCREYDVDGSMGASVARCEYCQDGYFLNTSDYTCVKGDIPNCKTYNNVNGSSGNMYGNQVCASCQTGYTLYANIGCLDLSNVDSRCSSWSISTSTLSNHLVLTCGGCNHAEYTLKTYLSLTSSETDYTAAKFTYKSSCLNVASDRNVANCKTQDYDVGSNHQVNGFTPCTECSSGYYLSQGSNYTCTARTKLDGNCETYNVTEDLCTDCAVGYFLGYGENDNKCYVNPTKTDRCVVFDYNNAGTVECIYCQDGYYLNSTGICTALLSAEQITNCQYHTGVSECAVCDSGYVLVSSILCKAANNCVTYNSNSECTECIDGYVVNSSNTCSAVTQCITSTGSTCTACGVGYYLNESNTCTAITTANLVTHCYYYSDATTCSQCAPGYYLATSSTGVTTCPQITYDIGDSINYTNCYKAIDGNTCSICQAGYSFVDGSCRANSSATLAQGCFDEDDNGNCWFCISGWTMGTTGKCTDNTPENNGISKLVGAFLISIFMFSFQII